jgi:hypothetical protein
MSTTKTIKFNSGILKTSVALVLIVMGLSPTRSLLAAPEATAKPMTALEILQKSCDVGRGWYGLPQVYMAAACRDEAKKQVSLGKSLYEAGLLSCQHFSTADNLSWCYEELIRLTYKPDELGLFERCLSVKKYWKRSQCFESYLSIQVHQGQIKQLKVQPDVLGTRDTQSPGDAGVAR